MLEDPDSGLLTVKPEDCGLEDDPEVEPDENPLEEDDWEVKDELPDEDPVEAADEAAEALILTKFC